MSKNSTTLSPSKLKIQELEVRVEDLEQTLHDIRMKCREEGQHDLAKILDIHEMTGKILDGTLLSDLRSGLK